MRICFIADARSPSVHNWISYFIERDHEVHLISSRPYSGGALKTTTKHIVPLAFSNFTQRPGIYRGNHNTEQQRNSTGQLKSIFAQIAHGPTSEMVWKIRSWLVPLDLYRHIAHVRTLIENIQPDLVHAMRIPYEGILAAYSVLQFPLIISVWGNDFTLFASSNFIIRKGTRLAMRRVDGLHADTFRDIRLAGDWGFSDKKPSISLPGSGGLNTSLFRPSLPNEQRSNSLNLPNDQQVVINPRGFRGYVRNDVFFQSIPLVLEQQPKTVFICPDMSNHPIAEQWIRKLGIHSAIYLLPKIPHSEMADLFRLAQVVVSPSLHDGTPNTMLEAMACGCFPVAGNIESVREWIEPGINGLLCDPSNPQALAQAILQALNDSDLRQRARQRNVNLIAERAEYGQVMSQVEEFYCQVIEQTSSGLKLT